MLGDRRAGINQTLGRTLGQTLRGTSGRWAPAAVFLAALVLRVAGVARIIAAETATPQIRGEILNIAGNIAQGRGFSSPFGAGSTPTAWECPLVPYLFAGFLRFAPSIPTAIHLIIIAQAVVGALAALVYWLIARKLVRDYGVFRPWLLPVFAAVVVFWPEPFLYRADPWYFVWQEAVLAVFVLLAMRWWDERVFSRTLALGVAGGVLVLINVTPLLVILFAILYPAVRFRNRKGTVGQAALCLGILILVVTPQLVRNAVVFGSFVPLRSNTGFELLKGNRELECIREPYDTPHPASNPEEFRRYMALGEVRYCRDAFGKALRYMRQHPGQTVERVGKRVYVIWATDLTDRWNPDANQKWWAMGLHSIVRTVIVVIPILAAIGILLWGVFTGRFARLPYAPLFAGLLLLLPASQYLTLADPEYLTAFRQWIGMISVFLVALDRKKAAAQHVNETRARTGSRFRFGPTSTSVTRNAQSFNER